MQRVTSFKLEGSISSLFIIDKLEDLSQLPKQVTSIGGGSNLVVNPKTMRAFVKVSQNFCDISFSDQIMVCSAGQTVSQLLKWMVENQQSGLEFAAGIPATIGGMVYMNFECWGIEITDIVESVFVYTVEKGARWINKKDYQYGYRWTSFHNEPCIILAVKLRLKPESSEIIKKNISNNIKERKKKQPILKSTFGSVFKNPLPEKAGQLIEALDLKGYRVGGAKISEQHANFIENVDSATYEDICEIIKVVQNKVLSRYNIELECEVKIIT